MAGPGLPTNIAAGGTTTGHKTHSDTSNGYVNKLDTTFLTPTAGKVLTGNGTTWAPADPSVDSSLTTRVAALERPVPNIQTGTAYTAQASDNDGVIVMDNANLNTVTLPSLAQGTTFGIAQAGLGVTTVAAGSGVTLRASNGNAVAGQYKVSSVWYKTSTEAWLMADTMTINPTDVTSLALWFRASDLSALADATAIDGNWSSAQGSSTATQTTSGNRPTKQTSSGATVVRFDGINDNLTLGGDALTCTQNAAGVTIFARMKMTGAPGATTAVVAGFSVNGSSNARAMMLVNASNFWTIGGRRLDADSFASVGTTTYDTTTLHTLCGILDYANSDAFMFLDGAAAGSTTTFQTSGSSSNTASNAARIGAAPDGTTPIQMDLRELIVYSKALSTTERNRVEAYLAGV